MTKGISSNSSVYSVERAAAMIGVSHVTLRTWAEKGELEAAKPVLFLNERQPVYTKEQIERLRKELTQRMSDSTASGSNGKAKRGFAAMTAEKRTAIARAGGRAAHARGTAHEFDAREASAAGRKGGVAVSQNREHMAAIGRRGGEARGARARLREREQLRISGSVALEPPHMELP